MIMNMNERKKYTSPTFIGAYMLKSVSIIATSGGHEGFEYEDL